MADEEKNTSAEIDDWLDDFEEADKTGAQIDQADIAALLDTTAPRPDPLGAVPSAPRPEQEAPGDGLDQSDIDALFGGADEQAPPPAAAKTDAPAGDGLDQSDIDALFGGAGEQAPPPAAAKTDAPAGDSLDQSDIDALFGGADEQAPPPAAAKTDAPAGDSLDQSDIDALFGGAGEQAPPPAAAKTDAPAGDGLDQSDIDALFGGAGEQAPPPAAAKTDAPAGDGLDQSDIDALFGGADEEGPVSSAPKAEAADTGEIDQNDIDALLGGSEAASPPASKAEAADTGEIDQSDIDALFGNSKAASPPAAPAAPPSNGGPVDQAEIDALFGDLGTETVVSGGGGGGGDTSDIDQLFDEFTEDAKSKPSETKPFTPEEVDFTELMADEGKGGDESFTLGEDDFGLNSTDFTLGTDETAPASEELFGEDEATQALPDFLATAPSAGEEATDMGDENPKFAMPPHFLASATGKAARIGAALLMVALLAGGGYLFLIRSKKPAIMAPPSGQQQVAAVEEPAANTAPQAVGHTYQMPKGGGEVPIQLTAEDKEKDHLTFEITVPPAHGRLSGELPKVVYLPNNDFPGEDRFTFLASDGKAVSQPVDIVITGPNLSHKPPTALARARVPKKPQLRAEDIDITMRSTDTLDLDWRRIWKEANRAPFGANVSVEIVGKDVHGHLTQDGPDHHRYQPDPYFSGREHIKYRFRRGKTVSKTRTVRLTLEMGTPPPEIHLAPLASSYQVGTRVTLDASATRDEKRQSLHFTWQQTSGTPVRLRPQNAEGSIVSFVVPSSFHTSAQSGPVLRLTATDENGQESSKEVRITTVSRRQTALWRGTPDGRVSLEPDCPEGQCPGRLLPWPYPN